MSPAVPGVPTQRRWQLRCPGARSGSSSGVKPPFAFPPQTPHLTGAAGPAGSDFPSWPNPAGEGQGAGWELKNPPLPPAPSPLGDPRLGTHLGHRTPTSGRAEPALDGGASTEERAGAGASREERLASGHGCEPRATLPTPTPRPAVSPNLLPACHHCCSSRIVPCPQTKNPMPAAGRQLHFLNEPLMRGVNQWLLPPPARGRAVGMSPCWWQCHCPHGAQ